jgi:hypothetical protein
MNFYTVPFVFCPQALEAQSSALLLARPESSPPPASWLSTLGSASARLPRCVAGVHDCCGVLDHCVGASQRFSGPAKGVLCSGRCSRVRLEGLSPTCPDSGLLALPGCGNLGLVYVVAAWHMWLRVLVSGDLCGSKVALPPCKPPSKVPYARACPCTAFLVTMIAFPLQIFALLGCPVRSNTARSIKMTCTNTG